MDQNTKDILAAVNFIKDKVGRLPTKDDVRAIVEEVVDEKLRAIHASLAEINRRLARSIRENDGREIPACLIDRVDGGGCGDDRNALAVEETGSRGACRVDHGPRVVIVPVIAASMAAWG